MENQSEAPKPQEPVPAAAKKHYKVKVLKKQVRFSLVQATAFVALFALIGGFILIKSFAASPIADVRGPILDSSPSTHATDELLVSFKPGASAAVQQALLNRYQAKVKQDIPQISTKLISVPSEAQDAVKEALSHNPAIKFVEYNQTVKAQDTTPNDYWWLSEYSQVTTQTNKAWDTTQGSAGTIIASLDTGVDFTQPDLQGKLLSNGYDFINNDSNPTDDHGHGTAVAGIAAAASNNTTGIASYCWKCMILPIKVMGANGSGTAATVGSGITYAADHGAKVISMSLGGTADSSLYSNAVAYAHNKGVIVLAAAGNYGTSAPVYPAADPGAIGVSGSSPDSGEPLYSWSDYGSWVKLAAPGCNFATGQNAWYGTVCGTSSATPAAAGIAGLLLSLSSNPTPAQVEKALTTAVDPCCGNQIGGGRVNAYKAIQALSGVSAPPADTTAPTVSLTSPAGGATVSGGINISVNASDNTAVTKVDLLIDGKAYATSATGPYSFYWDTAAAANGSHTLTATAYDAAGNAGSSSVTVTVSNLADTVTPAVTITSPADGSVAGKKVAIAAAGTDNVKVTGMEVYIDGVLKASSTTGSISYSWAVSPKVTKGTHTITVKAYDAANNIGTSSVTVTK